MKTHKLCRERKWTFQKFKKTQTFVDNTKRFLCREKSTTRDSSENKTRCVDQRKIEVSCHVDNVVRWTLKTDSVQGPCTEFLLCHWFKKLAGEFLLLRSEWIGIGHRCGRCWIRSRAVETGGERESWVRALYISYFRLPLKLKPSN